MPARIKSITLETIIFARSTFVSQVFPSTRVDLRPVLQRDIQTHVLQMGTVVAPPVWVGDVDVADPYLAGRLPTHRVALARTADGGDLADVRRWHRERC